MFHAFERTSVSSIRGAVHSLKSAENRQRNCYKIIKISENPVECFEIH